MSEGAVVCLGLRSGRVPGPSRRSTRQACCRSARRHPTRGRLHSLKENSPRSIVTNTSTSFPSSAPLDPHLHVLCRCTDKTWSDQAQLTLDMRDGVDKRDPALLVLQTLLLFSHACVLPIHHRHAAPARKYHHPNAKKIAIKTRSLCSVALCSSCP